MRSFEKEIAALCDPEMASLLHSYKYVVYGGHTVVVEGQKGVFSYAEGCIVFKIGKEKLSVSGENLTLCQLNGKFAVVRGHIFGVTVGQ